MDAASVYANHAASEDCRSCCCWSDARSPVHRPPLEIVDVQHLARTGSLGKAHQQSLSPGQRHVLALTAADRFRLQRLDPAAVIGHVGAVHGAQRYTHRLRDRGLGHSALAQQYHLNALPLSLRHFPMQRRLQLPNLALRAFDHPSPPKQMARWNHKISLPSGTKLPQTPRFNQLWKRYERFRCSGDRLSWIEIV